MDLSGVSVFQYCSERGLGRYRSDNGFWEPQCSKYCSVVFPPQLPAVPSCTPSLQPSLPPSNSYRGVVSFSVFHGLTLRR